MAKAAPISSSGPSIDSAKLERYVELYRRLKEIKDESDELSSERAALEETLLEQFAATSTKSIKTMSGECIFIHKQLWASAQDGDSIRLCDALRAAGEDWSFMVKETVNTQTLSSRIRECEADLISNPILPIVLQPAVKVTLRTKLHVRKG